MLPRNINSFKLGKLIGFEPLKVFETVQEVTNDICSDEFQILSEEAIQLVCLELLDKEVSFVDDADSKHKFMRRAPVITIMGHVDHGKTTLLDAFRTDFNKCAEEYGAITQSIGAFTISAPEFTRTDDSAELTNKAEGEVTFIDTPGHEAFVNLRSRGAKVTDIIILVISAVESVQKQTIEVIELARKMHVPFIVAINKIDRAEADVESVFYDLQNQGVVPEQLGGNVICVPISAKERVNLNLLKEKIN